MTLNPALRLRRAARLIVLDPEGRALMFRYDVPGRPPFWVTAGGEVEPDESFEDAARRELFEETGITADPGPQIAQMTPEFITVQGEPVQADERFFLVRVAAAEIDTSRHTELEQALVHARRTRRLARGDFPGSLGCDDPGANRNLIALALPDR